MEPRPGAKPANAMAVPVLGIDDAALKGIGWIETKDSDISEVPYYTGLQSKKEKMERYGIVLPCNLHEENKENNRQPRSRQGLYSEESLKEVKSLPNVPRSLSCRTRIEPRTVGPEHPVPMDYRSITTQLLLRSTWGGFMTGQGRQATNESSPQEHLHRGRQSTPQTVVATCP